ncbi:hypothetical protein Smar_1314 [Staphylothermus marinus F1]|uniref:DUF5622 domain-containing protein n=1 Tax=Staphylothermus marinus (strain ATCC 43588 / DSM 3639 / JCM 9404 / F1) TaxID=399550 RepID=A3DP45_STAMF|nr:hypothetical protein Smar_1314 [Staphylothermus marinus F1]
MYVWRRGAKIMGLKHGKYIYVERKDGWYVKVRVLNIRLKKKDKKEKYSFDINDPEKYLVLQVKTRKPPFKAQIMREDDVPDEVKKALYQV